jgi:hypothetical protein
MRATARAMSEMNSGVNYVHATILRRELFIADVIDDEAGFNRLAGRCENVGRSSQPRISPDGMAVAGGAHMGDIPDAAS